MMTHSNQNNHLVSFWEHLEELRKTLLKVLLICVVGILLSFIFFPSIYHLLINALPESKIVDHSSLKIEKLEKIRIANHSTTVQYHFIPETKQNRALSPGESFEYWAPKQNHLVLLSPFEGIATSIQLSFWLGIVLSSPFWLYQIFLFFKPALKEEESRLLLPFIGLSLVFFASGLLFCAQITLPLANEYFMYFNQKIGENLWSFSLYANYNLMLFLGNALAFEGAAVLLCLVHCGILTANFMREKRRYAIILFLILGALLSPPDVLTQLFIAVPLMLFYECAIMYSQIKQKRGFVWQFLCNLVAN